MFHLTLFLLIKYQFKKKNYLTPYFSSYLKLFCTVYCFETRIFFYIFYPSVFMYVKTDQISMKNVNLLSTTWKYTKYLIISFMPEYSSCETLKQMNFRIYSCFIITKVVYIYRCSLRNAEILVLYANSCIMIRYYIEIFLLF